MGFFSNLLNELIDIIEWVDTTQDTLVWKFERHNNAIKMGAKLTVRESQVAVFMNEGKVADVFTPGMYELSTQNLPILTALQSWAYGFKSPFKADVFFISTRQFTNQKWGTKNPVMLRDAEFGPVRLRAFGTFSFKVNNALKFLQEVSATNTNYTVDSINEQLRNTIVSRGMDEVAASKIPVLDLAANYDEVSALIKNKIQVDYDNLGLELTSLLVENISLPPEVEAALDKRSQMGIIGNLGAYAQYQAANAIEKSAENTIGGNLASAGMGLAAGAAMMGQAGNIFQQNHFDGAATNQAGTPPPLPKADEYFIAVDGKSDGPHSLAAVTKMVSAQMLTATTMVWKKGMAEWQAAGNTPELAELFENMPPPLPQV